MAEAPTGAGVLLTEVVGAATTQARPVPRGVVALLLHDRSARAGLLLGAAILVGAFLGPLVLRGNPNRLDPSAVLAPPSRAHLLGTDEYGRDELLRLVDGGRRSLLAATTVLGLGAAIGTVAGVGIAMSGGVADVLAMRLVDVVLALPDLVVVLAVLGALGPGFGNLVVALTIPTAAFVARLARSSVRGARGSPVVAAASAAGVARTRIVAGHVLPDVVAQVLVIMTMNIGMVLVGIAGLSFLGLGIQQPTADWGAMLADARLYMGNAPWLVLAPAGAIMLTLVAANLVADALVRVGATGA
ncbi:MAG TPA: ABC transporter permease [Actinomycetota bacterium]|nr:ABC transporter permease [Actinomycetota bacterium]